MTRGDSHAAGRRTARITPARHALCALACAFVFVAPTASAQPVAAGPVDRVAVRFEASELGGPTHPRFIFERTLAFEARLEALAERQQTSPPSFDYEERHVRAALERHVTEEILVSLPVEPLLRPDEIRHRFIASYLILQQQLGSRQALLDAAYLEGMEMEDLNAFVDRRARASLYLDRMVAPMLNPSDAKLRDVLRTEPTPFRGQHFEDIAASLRRWYVADRLRVALAAFFRSARARIRIVILRD
ncbi:MAG: hypothetical protein MUF54_22075 [Polyangiaceae bacterium]|nr:hypothetical protein [Polyangiaceae bacterium]